MKIHTLLANFDRLAEAPHGIHKLRELILQLAVRGKLVPQDPNDEPASELLKKIQVEKQHLIAEGLIRKRKPLPSIKPEERLQELPASWEWVRLGEVGIMSPRNTASDNEIAGFVPMSLVSDTFGSYPQKEERPWGEIKKGYTHFANGDVVLAKITPCFENGKSGVIRRLPSGFGAGTTELHVIRPIRDEVVPEYIWVFFKSPRFREAGEDHMTGTAGQKRVPRAYVESSLLPLPPFPEQKRIVAKVDELMALCDELEAKQQAKRTKQIALNRASLHALTQPNGTSIATAWQRVCDHFNALYTVPETVSELRQTILQLAVMGRLVPQDPNDEPASQLLKKIHAEKQRLIAEGAIRKTKAPQTIDPDLLAWELPQGWIWSRTADMLLSVSDGDHQPPPRSADGVPFLVIGNVSSGTLDFVETRHVPRAYYDQLDPIRVPRTRDVLYTVTGSYGITVVVDTEDEFCVQRHIAILKVPSLISPKFISTWLNSPLAIEQAAAGATGTAQKTVALGTLRNLQLPLPPLAEQKQIIAKVDKLMTLCNVLEARLQQAQTDADDLLAAIVHELTRTKASAEKKERPHGD